MFILPLFCQQTPSPPVQLLQQPNTSEHSATSFMQLAQLLLHPHYHLCCQLLLLLSSLHQREPPQALLPLPHLLLLHCRRPQHQCQPSVLQAPQLQSPPADLPLLLLLLLRLQVVETALRELQQPLQLLPPPLLLQVPRHHQLC
jgi:hypothetical protein